MPPSTAGEMPAATFYVGQHGLQIQKLSTGELGSDGFSELLTAITELNSKSQHAGPKNLVLPRA